ncbi:hypothetical protein LEP1GSC043_1813 [Leptospira weilii str. Ecochallenge]|uniref:Uncharacterized protein n=1 Tax=Leptospira weilii str. Ecochallenge TaxID=1049986 RepID=N1U6C0_9LEPT|nr:hypothetical protein LEP1GSC043_1813 [Leptospira weilii str. Ecochallenge]
MENPCGDDISASRKFVSIQLSLKTSSIPAADFFPFTDSIERVPKPFDLIRIAAIVPTF